MTGDELLSFAAAARYIKERWGAQIDPRTVKTMALAGTLSWAAKGDSDRMLIVRESIDARFDRNAQLLGPAHEVVN